MRRIYTIILLSLFMRLSAMAAFHSVNVDKATIAAMRAAYEIENETEQQGLNALDSISNKYTKSNISIAQIFLAEKSFMTHYVKCDSLMMESSIITKESSTWLLISSCQSL